MATSSKDRAAPGARTAPPKEQSNPEPQVGEKPNEAVKPPEVDPAPIEFSTPPALVPEQEGEKITVETTGPFMILDPMTLNQVPHKGSAEVIFSTFIGGAINDGRLKQVK